MTLHIASVAHTYSRRRSPALDNLHLNVAPGSVACLIGPNGSGKSTALKLVVGLIPVAVGSISVNGAPSGATEARRATAFVPDDPAGFDELTAQEYLLLVQHLWTRPSGFDTRVEDALVALEAHALLPQRLAQLSHGSRRLITMVGAYGLGTPLWVIDEANAGLDPERSVGLRRLMRKAADEGTAVLAAGQDLHFFQKVADFVVILDHGATVTAGDTDSLLARYGAIDLEGVFLRATGRDVSCSG